MKKVYLFYIATIGLLYFALFSVFSVIGLGTDVVAFEATEPQPAITPDPEPISFVRGVDYPDLQPQQLYSVSHATPIFADPEGILGRSEELPSGGFFMVELKEEYGADAWYRVMVNGGGGDYPMYLKAADLNWKVVETVRDEKSRAEMSREEKIAQLEAALGVSLRRQAAPPEPEPVPEPQASERMVAAVQDSIRNASSQGIASAALAAGVTTIGIALALSILVMIRGTRRWESSTVYEEVASNRGEEFYEAAPDEPGAGDF